MRDEPFVGWRVWRIFDWQEAVIGAAVMDWAWEGPRLSIPEKDHAGLPTGNGFHAFKSFEHISAYLNERIGGASMMQMRAFWMPHWGFTIDPPQETPPSPRYRPRLSASELQTWVIGKVRLFGTVVEYEHGYRSSDAIIDVLGVHPAWDEGFRHRLAARYQCDVEENRCGHTLTFSVTFC